MEILEYNIQRVCNGVSAFDKIRGHGLAKPVFLPWYNKPFIDFTPK